MCRKTAECKIPAFFCCISSFLVLVNVSESPQLAAHPNTKGQFGGSLTNSALKIFIPSFRFAR